MNHRDKNILTIFVLFLCVAGKTQTICNKFTYTGLIAIEAGDSDYQVGDMIFRGPAFYIVENCKVAYNDDLFLFDYFDIAPLKGICSSLTIDSLSLMLADSSSPMYVIDNALRSSETQVIVASKGRVYKLYSVDYDAVYVGSVKHIHYLNGRKRHRKHPTYVITKIRKIEAVENLCK